MSYQNRFYLTGSINQPTVADAFDFVGKRLQPGATRVPDGEPGDRANWVLTQTPHFLQNPTLDVVESDGGSRARLREGSSAADVAFPAPPSRAGFPTPTTTSSRSTPPRRARRPGCTTTSS